MLNRRYIINQINQYYIEVIYKVDNIMFLFSKNIIIAQLSKKLNNKILELFKIITKVGYLYYLKLLRNIRIYNIFYSSLLYKAATNSLPR